MSYNQSTLSTLVALGKQCYNPKLVAGALGRLRCQMTEQNLWSMARLGECDDMFCKEQDVVQACRDLQKRCVKELAGLMRYPKKFSRCTTKLSPEDDQTYRKMMELLEELFCENCRNVDC